MTVAAEFKWFIQDLCNYSCPYCEVSGARRKMGPWLTSPVSAREWIGIWNRIYAKYGRVAIHITGGEPTIFPGFIGMVEEMARRHHVGFDTNLSWKTEELRLFASAVAPASTSVDISFHPHAEALEAVIEKASFLRDRGYTYVCRLVAYPALLEKIPFYRAAFEKAGLNFVVNPYQGPFRGRRYPDSYTPQESDSIADVSRPLLKESLYHYREQHHIANHLLKMHVESPQGKLCRSGQVYCRVGHDGTVHRCQPYENGRWEPLGNISDESFSLWSEPRVCRSPVCEFEYRYLVDSWRSLEKEPPHADR